MTGPSASLIEDLDRFRAHFEQRVGPAVTALIKSSTSDLAPLEARVIPAGKPFPAVTSLLDMRGKAFNLSKFLKTQRAVVFFYRGSWCPYCKLTLRAFEDAHSLFMASGTALVAISPELPEFGAETVERHGLSYTVLSDPGAKLIRAAGLDYALPSAMRPLFEAAGHALPDRNGDSDWVLPLTAAFIVEPPGTIRDRFVSPDYTKRMELAAALAAVRA